jgi:hypothetical protein
MITLHSGDKFVSEFHKLRGLGRYSADVFGGRKSFNVWKVLSRTHPASGETCLVRQRLNVGGKDILFMQQVEPNPTFAPDQHATMDPMYFQPVPIVEKGPHGLHIFADTDDLPDGARPGIGYPIHREPETLRQYVWLDVAASRKHYLEDEISAVPVTEMDEEEGEDGPF